MLFNILLGIVLPWTVAILVVRKQDWYIVAIMSPFGTTLGYSLNTLWCHQGFGYMLPKFQDNITLAGLPCELGMFPVSVSLLVITVQRTGRTLFPLILFPLVMVSCEAFGLLIGKLVYLNDWNLFETYVEYFAGFTANLWYWKVAKRLLRSRKV